MEPLLKIVDVAKRLSLSRTATYAILDSGALPSIRIGKCRRVKPSDLVAFVEARTTRGQVDE